ncbi:MAG: hypothetical protein QNJ04_09295 [Desulfobacterales bacterium]|nr:hypothetical protein [Desulfobacterales bacterium]
MGTFHGITSLVLLALAMLVGLIGVALNAPSAAVAYILVLVVAFLVICAAYCAKCPCRTDACGHLLPGLVASYLPARRQTHYHTADMALTALALAAMVFYPQYWLWQHPALLALFWLLTAGAGLQIVRRVCPSCQNPHCPMKKGTTGIRSLKADRPAD